MAEFECNYNEGFDEFSLSKVQIPGEPLAMLCT